MPTAHSITLAADATALTTLFHDAEADLGTTSKSGSGSLGPFFASWGASAYFAGGTVQLSPPNVVQITDCELHYSLNFSFGIDLNNIVHVCFPQICLFGWCTPAWCVSFPTVTIPFPTYSDAVKFSAQFALQFQLKSGIWNIDIVVVGVPFLELSVAAAAILAGLAAAIGAVLSVIPFIGPVLDLAVQIIIDTIGIAGVAGLLGAILTPFVAGLTFTIYEQPQMFQVLAPSLPLDPAVNIQISNITASVLQQPNDKAELVIYTDISN